MLSHHVYITSYGSNRTNAVAYKVEIENNKEDKRGQRRHAGSYQRQPSSTTALSATIN